VNADLSGAPETINEDPYGAGWMIEIRLADASELDGLMSSDDYQAFVESDA
jgi:glycine cleavage system H protein